MKPLPSLVAAILYEGTVEIALEDLKEVGLYTAKKKEFVAGVEFSVEQVTLSKLDVPVSLTLAPLYPHNVLNLVYMCMYILYIHAYMYIRMYRLKQYAN